ncbi:hypothetical protein AACH06_21275 [Ideonella sp. DXS29W]|uniref:DUF11 domain-containing protein n=1 Tax=Ideonella lacteola TaxID=2984193 RepID=A0ABU9BY36_9BURK
MRFRSAALAITSLIAATAVHAGIVGSPNPVSFSGQGGRVYLKTITITNQGPGFASNLSASLNLTGGSVGEVNIGFDTCTGATLAVGGTCSVRLVFDSGCPYAGWVNYNLVITSSSQPTLSIPVSATTKAGICV